MDDFIKIGIENIIKESQTTDPRYCDKKYVIYYNKKEKREKIRINTYYYNDGKKIKLCRYYDRGLCNTMDEYKNLDLQYIESQAYGSWMDGAR